MSAQWDDLKAVLHVVRHGSLSAAGEVLHLNYTTIARRIARAENALNLKLFERLADGYRATPEGIRVSEAAEKMEQREIEMLRELQGQDSRLSGSLVVTAPQLMIGPNIAPVISKFVAAHPDVHLHLKASNNLVDLSRREADLAIRISNSPGDSLKGMRLTEQNTASFAAPEWKERLNSNPEAQVHWIVYDRYPNVPKEAVKNWPNSRVVMSCNDMAAMLGAAVAGLGVVRMPMFLGRATPGLVQVDVLPPQPYAAIWVVGHPDVWPSAKVKAFRDLLVSEFRGQRARFVA